ncbi:MAG: deoxyribose-phosphate aldolase [Erysipelotrichaceae bacterium]|nr:deoxyribose-phosphate aldolase [Erysipelotrichaceae bacterium]
MISKKELACLIDSTNLHADIKEEYLIKLCDDAKKYNFKSVAINSCQVAKCCELLKGSGVLVGAAISFPLGQTTIATKLFEAQEAINNGCKEFDYVINIGKMKDHDYSYIENEMQQMVDLARKNDVCCKVIFENCYLNKDEKIELCNMALRIKPDFIKTSTGFGASGAKVEDIKLMKSIVGNKVKIKAAGGIRTYEEARSMVEAGASRIGTSRGTEICN